MGLGLTEILIVLLMLVLFFGAKRLPGLARGLRKSVTSFKAGIREEPVDENGTADNDSRTEKRSP